MKNKNILEIMNKYKNIQKKKIIKRNLDRHLIINKISQLSCLITGHQFEISDDVVTKWVYIHKSIKHIYDLKGCGMMQIGVEPCLKCGSFHFFYRSQYEDPIDHHKTDWFFADDKLKIVLDKFMKDLEY